MANLPKFLTDPDPNIYERNDYLILDFETTINDKGSALSDRNSIVLTCWQAADGTKASARAQMGGVGNVSVHTGNEFELNEVVRAVEKASFLVAHNAKFELQWLERCGLDLSNVLVWDTMIAEYVLGGNRWTHSQLSLENCAKRHFGEGKMDVISKMYKAGLCSTEIPASWLERYCKLDVTLTHKLFLEQREQLKELGLLPVVYTRNILTPVLADIEKNGMQLDADRIVEQTREKEEEYAAIQVKLEEMTGGINVNSTKQLREFLYGTLGFDEIKKKQGKDWIPDRTDSGLPKTDLSTIMRLKPSSKQQREFLKLFKQSKTLYNELTKYLRKFNECSRDADGLLTAQFNQCNTQTHRLSSAGRNYSTQFQNFPRDYKPVFRARTKGWLVGECDGAQLEFRVAAHLGRDKAAMADILNAEDIHEVTAGVIGVSRQDAKAHTFKPLYGGRSGTVDERRYYEFFREKYSGITDTQYTWIDEVVAKKSLTTEWGMRYYWPHVRMDRSGYVNHSTAICNYPVQALATAEIIPIALTAFWHRLKRSELKMFIVNTVHDSIIVELPPEEVEDFHELARKCLIEDVYPYLEKVYNMQFTVPLGAGVKVGSHWNDKDCADWVPEGLEHDKGEVKYEAQKELYSRNG